jgi:hypothetical protein
VAFPAITGTPMIGINFSNAIIVKNPNVMLLADHKVLLSASSFQQPKSGRKPSQLLPGRNPSPRPF